jgi:uncharacterized protein YjbJ (UPF0337 family)
MPCGQAWRANKINFPPPRRGANKNKYMNTLEIKGDWNITKGKLKQKWATLTDSDLQFAEGKHDELLGRIQKRTGETREVVEKAIKEFTAVNDGK